MEAIFNQNKQLVIFIILSLLLFIIGYYIGVRGFAVQTDNHEVITFCDDLPAQELASKDYYYEVFGAVRNPGIYKADKELLIMQAIENAGGFSTNADTAYVYKMLKLAVNIKPAEKVYIPAIGEHLDSNYSVIEDGAFMINFNTASLALLDSIVGVGEATANKIIAARPFQSCEDVNNIPNINKTVKQTLLEVCRL